MLRRPRMLRWLVAVIAATTVATGLVGAYSYGNAYSQHRGFATIARVRGARPGRLVTVHFFSHALHRRTDYLVYLPPRYTPSRRYPVYYLLHGSPGAPDAFLSIANLDVRLVNRMSERVLHPLILVFPDGRINGDTFSDSEWANTPSGNFQSYVVDVVHDVDRRFATVPIRQARVIAGYSAGAYGAINVALHELPTFANVQVWSGYYVETRSGAFAHASRALLAANSPLDYAGRLGPVIARYPVRVYMFVGRKDPASVQIGPMARLLRSVGAQATYNIFPGGHDWEVWYSRVDRMLLLASQMVSPALAGGPIAAPTPAPVAPRMGKAAIGRHRAGVAHRGHARHSEASRLRSTRARHAAGPPLRGPTRPRPQGRQALAIGLVLALLSAALINLGFLLQHRALRGRAEAGLRAWGAMLRHPTWLTGQALGWVGFGLQIVAVALAPLSLVQAFAAGGLALSLPLAALGLRHRVTRGQGLTVVTVAAALALLPLDLGTAVSRTHAGGLAAGSAAAVLVAAFVFRRGSAAGRALAAGALYGIADAGIKAAALAGHRPGAAAGVAGWAGLAAVATLGGFLMFQAALRDAEPVGAISLMTAVTALVALLFGVLAFGESLGRDAGATLLHLLAITTVLVCVPVLVAGEHQLAVAAEASQDDHDGGGRRLRRWPTDRLARTLRRALLAAAAAAFVPVTLVSGFGLLYGLRGLGWLGAGPPVRDALPLLQLAGFDAQPLARIVAAWLAVGLACGTALVGVRPLRRAALVGVPALVLLLFGSEVAFALARNLRLLDVVQGRTPGPGPWIEALVFAAAAILPRALKVRAPRWLRRPVSARPVVSSPSG